MFYDSEIKEKNHFTGPSSYSKPSYSQARPEQEVDFGTPIEFSPDLAYQLYEFTQVFIQNFDLVPISQSCFTKEIRSELFRFWIALKSYKESNNPLMSIDELVNGMLQGPDYLVYLKKLRSYHMVISRGGRFEEEDPSLQQVIARSQSMPPLKDIGQIFNVRFYFFWSQPDEEDWKYFFEPQGKISDDLLDEVYRTAMFLLPDITEVVEEEEILLSATSSNSKDKTGQSLPNWYLKQKDNKFSCDPLVGYGSYIQKCPGDTRYSVTLSVPQSNTVKLIEKQFSLVAAEMPWSCYVKNTDVYEKRYKQFASRNQSFYCRDLKKDGITKVRPLLVALGKALKEKYPQFPASKYLDIYRDFYLCHDGHTQWTPRGVGLGMSSALTTILQSVIFKMTLDRAAVEIDYPVSCDAIIYHDDIAIGAEHQHELEDFNDIEDRLFNELKLIKNKKKSFFADWFVLCEYYSDEILNSKDSYEKYLLNLPLASVNISHAKTQFANNLRFIHQNDWQSYLDGLISYWGYEYHPNEASKPFGFGGWVPAHYMSVDISFLACDEIDHFDQAAALAYTARASAGEIRNKKVVHQPYLCPSIQVYGDLHFGGCEDHFNVGITTTQMLAKLAGFKRFGSKTYYWRSILNKRRKLFEQNMLKPCLDIKEFYLMYSKLHINKDVYPPRDLLIKESVDEYVEVESLYKPTNPNLQFLAYHNPGKFKKGIIPWPIRPDSSMDSNMQLSAEERLRLQYDPHLMKCYRLGEMPLIKVPERLILSPYWYNTNQMIAASSALSFGQIIPKGFLSKVDLSAINADLYLELSGPNRPLIERIARVTPYNSLLQILNHLTTLGEELLPICQAKLQAMELIKAYNIAAESLESLPLSISDHESAQGWSDSPLSDSGYFLWQYSHQKYKDWRNVYFRRIADKFANVELARISWLSNKNYQDVELGDDLKFDDVERYLYIKSGGQIDSDGYPIINVSAIPEMGVARDTEDGNDIFLDEDDDVGLGNFW